MADDATKQETLRRLPKVDDVLRQADVAALASDLPRWAVVETVRREIDDRRRKVLANGDSNISTVIEAETLRRRVAELVAPSLRRVINATGVVLHTNLGRAPLAEAAVRLVGEVARGYSNLEYDVGGRSRGSRHDHLRELTAELTGAEAAVVVNNNAAAVLLTLTAMASGKEVLVSRGELVEIGGSFRVPDVMRASGAVVVEVGTTNKTRLRDYEDAITPNTGALLKVHKSNFAMIGFTEEVEVAALVALGKARGIPVIVDLGSGTIVDPATMEGAGLPSEPTVGAVVGAGPTLVTFSGDKLLGGPQAGVICGTAAAVDKVRKHPLMRALRPDKLTLAALEATLELYRDGRALEEVPTLRMLAATPASLKARAEKLAAVVGAGRGQVIEIRSAVGGGALPTAEPPSWALALSTPDGRSLAALDLALREGHPPVIGRIAEGRLLLDVRTVAPSELGELARRVREALVLIGQGVKP